MVNLKTQVLPKAYPYSQHISPFHYVQEQVQCCNQEDQYNSQRRTSSYFNDKKFKGPWRIYITWSQKISPNFQEQILNILLYLNIGWWLRMTSIAQFFYHIASIVYYISLFFNNSIRYNYRRRKPYPRNLESGQNIGLSRLDLLDLSPS